MAEEDKRALLRISCGDLGQHPYEVERKLQALLKLALRGSAIVLIDEADTFLAKRATGGGLRDYFHNAIVSIFLKHLEYFPGVIFLTTNQETEFDEAVSSRVVCLRYGPLNAKGRAKIWKNNLMKGGHNPVVQVIEPICEELGNEYQLDGREIKNLAQLSLAICRRRKQEVSKEIIQQMYDLTHGTR
jgi:SpoVK/Ycf46/Vps4 family AAA+-type ATPase